MHAGGDCSGLGLIRKATEEGARAACAICEDRRKHDPNRRLSGTDRVPIGKSVTNPDGDGVKGKEAVGAFFDNNIAANRLTITCEETFPSSSPDEIAHILVLHSKFEGGFTSEVRGVFTYKVNDAGLISNMRGYWNLDVMKFGKEE